MSKGTLSQDMYNKVFNTEYKFFYETIINRCVADYLRKKYNLKIKTCFLDSVVRYNYNRSDKRVNHIRIYIYSYSDFDELCVNKDTREKGFVLINDLKQYVIDICNKNGLTEFINIGDLYMSFDCFESEAIRQINRKSNDEKDNKFIPKYFNPETMEKMYSHLTVIYKNKEFLRQAVESGETKRIADAYYEFIKPYDEYDILTRENTKVLFDSMESVEAHGGWFHYDRDIAF